MERRCCRISDLSFTGQYGIIFVCLHFFTAGFRPGVYNTSLIIETILKIRNKSMPLMPLHKEVADCFHGPKPHKEITSSLN